MTGSYEEVDGTRIHYEKVGWGSQILLMLPGGVGTANTDFTDQIDGGLNHDLFTMIIIDLPGFGKSRPPERVYAKDSFHNDASKAAGLMDKLGYKLYSVLGWCHGARIALLVAINQQARVDKLVIWGGYLYTTSHEIRALSLFRDIDTFDSKSAGLLCGFYGRELFERLWHRHVDSYVNFPGKPEEIFDVRKEARSIRCPTLIIHGDKDAVINKEHPVMLERTIPDARLVRFPNAPHELHQVVVEKFNKTVTDFLLEE